MVEDLLPTLEAEEEVAAEAVVAGLGAAAVLFLSAAEGEVAAAVQAALASQLRTHI